MWWGTAGTFITVLPNRDMIAVQPVDIDKNARASVSQTSYLAMLSMIANCYCGDVANEGENVAIQTGIGALSNSPRISPTASSAALDTVSDSSMEMDCSGSMVTVNSVTSRWPP